MLAALCVAALDVEARDPEDCFICPDIEECPWDPPGYQPFNIMCAAECGWNFTAIRCTEDHPDCDIKVLVECTDEVSK
jgi:hypothetical protein